MKTFEQLHLDEQTQLLGQLMETLGDNDCYSVDELARRRDCSLREVWRDICADTGLDECEPWNGFPKMPNLPEPPKHQDRELTAEERRRAQKAFRR